MQGYTIDNKAASVIKNSVDMIAKIYKVTGIIVPVYIPFDHMLRALNIDGDINPTELSRALMRAGINCSVFLENGMISFKPFGVQCVAS